MGYDVHIVRTSDWLEAGSAPIVKGEVDAAIAAASDLAWSADFVEMTEPDGTTARYHLIAWHGASCGWWWYRDQILSKDPDHNQLLRLVALARALGAKVVGDDGERYEAEKSLFGRTKVKVIPPAA